MMGMSAEIRAALQYAECHEDVTRKGESVPCDAVAVALRIDPTEGNPYPVCAYHARDTMVSLTFIAALLPEVTETVEWGVRFTEGDPDFTPPDAWGFINREGARVIVGQSPATRTLVTRTRRHIADEVSEWTEVQP